MKKDISFEEQVKGINDQILNFKNWAWGFVWVGIVFFIIGVIYWIFKKDSDFNEVGDFIGGVAGSLWALSGLFFIYVAFLGQKVEIKYQQEDLTLTREELQETKEVFKKQTLIMSNQQLDNTFFNLLENHRKLVENFSTNLKNFNSIKVESGYQRLIEYGLAWKRLFFSFSKLQREKIAFTHTDFYIIPSDMASVDPQLTLLFNEINHIITFIDSKVISKNDKKFYFETLSNNLIEEEKWLFGAYLFSLKKSTKEDVFKIFTDVLYHPKILEIFRTFNFYLESNEFYSNNVTYKYNYLFLHIEVHFHSFLLLTNHDKVLHVFKRENNRNFQRLDLFLDYMLLERLSEEGSDSIWNNAIIVVEHEDFKHLFKFTKSKFDQDGELIVNLEHTQSFTESEKLFIEAYLREHF